jgi:low temperature requirement protein LtrA
MSRSRTGAARRRCDSARGGGHVSESAVGQKRVTWAELFFDLVFVFAVTQVSELLHGDHSWAGVYKALVVFVPIWWSWVGTTIHANARDVDNPVDRLGVFAVGLCSLFMALAVPEAYGDRGLLYGAMYLLLRVILAMLVFRDTAVVVNAFSVAVVVTGPLLVAGGLLHDGWRLALWTAAAAIDLSVPRLIRRRLATVRFAAGHLPERFGLFVIIALGESIVAVGRSAEPDLLTPARLSAVAAAYALTCSLWWLYFVYSASALRQALSAAAVQTDIIRPVLAYAHVVLIGSIITIAVGLAEVTAHPEDHLDLSVAALLAGGCAAYLGTFGYTHWRMFRRPATVRLVGAAVCLATLPLCTRTPAVVAVFILVVVTVLVNVAEAWAVRSARWRLAGGPPAPVLDE